MRKSLLLAFLLSALTALFASPEFYPRLWIEGYNPLVYNTVDIYKLYRGNNYLKQSPYFISTFAPTQDELIDFESGKVVITTKVGDYELDPGRTLSFDRYFANLRGKAFRRSLFEHYRNRSTQTEITNTGLIKEYVLELPTIAVPKSVQKVFGSSAGKLNLDGTEKVTIEVGSTKRKNVAIYETENTGQFDIKMEQETNLRLTGTIGDKIGVNLKYNSKQDEQLFDPNNISIKYTGNEDELIQTIEGGNITLALSGSRYISYSTASRASSA
jgi:cell surface protein SprA